MAHDEHVTSALWILEALTAAPGHRMDARTVQREIDCSAEELDAYLELLSNLADRQGGGRAVVLHDGDDLVLVGDAAHMRPLRLTEGEGAALSHVLETLNLDHDLADRLRRSLIGSADDTASVAERLISDTRVFGSWYQTLAEAAADGVRIRIRYRAQTDNEPRERTVDPIALETTAESTYLIAWNVDKRAERRYRLDRIDQVLLTDESVERHTPDHQTVDESLAQNGEPVTVTCSTDNALVRSWAGICSQKIMSDDPQRYQVSVRVSTPAWLFDQVLAAAGDMEITAPEELRAQFVDYARALLDEGSES